MRRSFALLIVSLLMMFGCASPYKWTVEEAATPNPFVGQRSFSVPAAEFHQLRVGDKSEAEYLDGKSDDQRASWSADKVTMNDEFRHKLGVLAMENGIRANEEPAPFAIHTIVHSIEPGYWGGVIGQPARVEASIRVVDTSGKVLDEINVSAVGLGATTHRRLTEASDFLAQTVARFLAERVSKGSS
jgi:hypothetical protein